MKKKLFLIISLLAFSMGLTGCFDQCEDECKLPWAQPAKWENKGPGLDSMLKNASRS